MDGALIGPADLAMSLGVPVQPDNPHPDHVAACAEVLTTCRRRGLPAGIFTSGTEESVRRVSEGWRFISIGTDMQYVRDGALEGLRRVRAARAFGGG